MKPSAPPLPPLSHTAPLTHKRTVGYQDSVDIDRIWQLLGSIKTTDRDQLNIQYSQDGIFLSPENSGYYGPFMGGIGGVDHTSIFIGLNRRPEFAYGVFRDTITVGTDVHAKNTLESIHVPDASHYIYYGLEEWDGGGTWYFRAVLRGSETYPVQSAATPYFPVVLGKSIWDDENERIKNWVQYWQGGNDIHFPMPTVTYSSTTAKMEYQYQTEHERLITTAELCE